MKKCIKVQYGSKVFPVNAEFSRRKTFSVTVYPDQTIVAKIPDNVSEKRALELLKKKSRWINEKMQYFEKFQPIIKEKHYMSGEEFYYLGRQYRLNIIKSRKEDVKLKGKFINIYTTHTQDRQKKKQLIYKWYRDHAVQYITKRIELYSGKFKKRGIEAEEIRFRRMKRRWGSCSGKRIITFNTELVRAPVHCIDYVIIHEFIHLKYMKHDKKFYRTLEYIMPDWQLRKERLEGVQIPE
ncbi:MAG: SprT family zinc-dependent metalloprotease [bacterium]